MSDLFVNSAHWKNAKSLPLKGILVPPQRPKERTVACTSIKQARHQQKPGSLCYLMA